MEHAFIAIVDDCEAIRDILTEVLEAEGYHVTVFENGLHAMHAFTAGQRFDLVLLDLMMPMMSGWELLDKLSKFEINVGPFIVMSAVVDRHENVAHLPSQLRIVSETLKKPFELELLLGTVRKHCRAA